MIEYQTDQIEQAMHHLVAAVECLRVAAHEYPLEWDLREDLDNQRKAMQAIHDDLEVY